MKRIRKTIYILFSILFIFLIVSCGSSKADSNYPSAGAGGESSFVNESTTRKIIYEANISLHVSNIEESYKKVKELLPSDAWTQTENASSDYYYLVIRVRYTDFDKYINDISSLGDVDSCQKRSYDVTSTYDSLVNKKQALETEHTRLLELMSTASASDITNYITPRLTEIETQLLDINDSLTKYDESIDYSTLYLNMYETKVTHKKSFGTLLKNAFIKGGKAFGTVFKYLLIAIVFILPFALLAGAIVLIVILVNKKKNNNNSNKKKEIDDDKKIEEKDE